MQNDAGRSETNRNAAEEEVIVALIRVSVVVYLKWRNGAQLLQFSSYKQMGKDFKVGAGLCVTLIDL